MGPALDALVIGAGPAGSTAALVLARAGWSVGVIDRASFPREKVCGEFLSATSLPLLRQLGLADTFLELAGPEVRRVGLIARDRLIVAEMPRLQDGLHGWGRALGREHLDALLLARAVAEGATVWQPWNLAAFEKVSAPHIGDQEPDHYRCTVVCAKTRQTRELRARVVIAAHGSWGTGRLTPPPQRQAPRASDLFWFKAHFLDTRLATGLMPLIAFPGGYGGLVHTDHGRVSLSCCVRRDQLDLCRRLARGTSAGEAVFQHMQASCAHLRDALDGASLEKGWRSIGPLRPGVRSTHHEGVFLAGNAAGEAHPVVAEGISMAMQSGSLLAEHLVRTPRLADVRAAYDADWRRAFVPRIRAASVIAHWAMDPVAVRLALPFLRAVPAILTVGARLSGKVTTTVGPHNADARLASPPAAGRSSKTLS